MISHQKAGIHDMCTLDYNFGSGGSLTKDIWASSWVELPAETTSWPFNRGLDLDRLADIRVTFYVTCQVSFCSQRQLFARQTHLDVVQHSLFNTFTAALGSTCYFRDQLFQPASCKEAVNQVVEHIITDQLMVIWAMPKFKHIPNWLLLKSISNGKIIWRVLNGTCGSCLICVIFPLQ